jgi:predicted Rossmann fold nucleotide-binding protein DprA/Smf involved in DNA uptake
MSPVECVCSQSYSKPFGIGLGIDVEGAGAEGMDNVTVIRPNDSTYPAAALEKFHGRPPIAALGNLHLIHGRPLALFCSIKCPGDVILRTYDLIRALRDAGIPLIGGFHSPMEKECLHLLLRGTQPVLVCPARSLEGMRLPRLWKGPVAEGRLLVLSPFAQKERRITADQAQIRNHFVAALADQILVAHAGAGSKTESFVRNLQAAGKPVWTLASGENEHLLSHGVRALEPDRALELVNAAGLAGG